MSALRKGAIGLLGLATSFAGCHRARVLRAGHQNAAVPSQAQVATAWPPLPTTGYISGRVATAADVQRGNAVFAACVGVVGQTLHFAIPQYALWHDPLSDSIKRVFVVEAEWFEGDSMFGLRQIPSGKDAMATIADVQLLGQTPPAPAGSGTAVQ